MLVAPAVIFCSSVSGPSSSIDVSPIAGPLAVFGDEAPIGCCQENAKWLCNSPISGLLEGPEWLGFPIRDTVSRVRRFGAPMWLYFRFALSFRNVEELFAHRGIDVSYETVQCWTIKFGPKISANLRRRKAPPSPRWRLNEMVSATAGERVWDLARC